MNLIPRSFYLDDIFDDFEPVKHNNFKCDIYEEDNAFKLDMDIPGFDKKDVKIEVDNGIVTISAEKEDKNDDTEKNYIRHERIYNKYQRSFNFGDIDDESIKAEFKNGMLSLTIPKKEQIETRKTIEID